MTARPVVDDEPPLLAVVAAALRDEVEQSPRKIGPPELLSQPLPCREQGLALRRMVQGHTVGPFSGGT